MKTQVSPNSVPFNYNQNIISYFDENSESDSTLYYLKIKKDVGTDVFTKAQSFRKYNTKSFLKVSLIA